MRSNIVALNLETRKVFLSHLESCACSSHIFIFFETQKKHWEQIKLILKRFRKYNFFVNLIKCRFMIISMKFLNYIVNNHDVSMNFNRVKAIKIWSISTSFCQLQIFLSFVNFYRRFVVKYVNISRSLSKLLKSNKNDCQMSCND